MKNVRRTLTLTPSISIIIVIHSNVSSFIYGRGQKKRTHTHDTCIKCVHKSLWRRSV